MEEFGEEIAKLMLSQNAVFYLCGDAKGMTKGVHDALTTILSKYGNVTSEEATKMLAQWMKEKRYVWDIWI